MRCPHRQLPRRAGATPLLATSIVLLTAVLAGCVASPADDEPGADPPASSDAEAADDTAGDQTATEPPDGGPDDDALEPEPAAEPVLTVVATVAPLADLVAQVGGDRVAVTSLVPAGVDSHTYEPRPQDVVALSEADAYIGIGLGLNDGALRLAEANLPDRAPLVQLGELALGDADLVFDHDHSHDHDHGHSHDHEHGPGPNPHVWTSLRNAAALVDAIATTLASLDPDGAAGHAERAAALRSELEELHQHIDGAVVTIPEANRTLVTYHDAWAYFARDHALEFATAVQPADYSEPSAAEVRAVIDLVRELGVPAVFGSEVFPSRVLETIAAETGAVYIGDLADDVLPGAPGDPDHTYLGMMRRNAVVIVEALGGDASALRR